MKDRIEKQITLKAPQGRVWQAIADSKQFRAWFGLDVKGPWKAGETISAVIRPTTVDPEVAKAQAPHDGTPFELSVERIEPERLFSFRWHPYAVEKGVDYSKEPSTLVTFTLTPVTGGTRLEIVESGFDQIPLARRATAFASNEGGWEAQTKLIEKYLGQQHAA